MLDVTRSVEAEPPLRRWTEYTVDEIRSTALSPGETEIVKWTGLAFSFLVVFQKIAVGPNIEVGFFFIFALILWLVYRRHAVLIPLRAISYLLICTLMIAFAVYSPLRPEFSVPALIFMIFMHVPFLFRVNISRIAYLRIVLTFQNLALLMASMVFFQWAQQAAHMPMISMGSYIPESWFLFHYNYIQKVGFYSVWYKPNAFFMLETSFTSQLLAMSLLFEIALFRRPWRILYIGVAQIMTFGGTGILILAAGMLVCVFYMRTKQVIILACAVPVMFFVALPLGVVHNAIGRTSEISRPGTSGNGRLMAPVQVATETATSSLDRAIFGVGPGLDSPFKRYKQEVLNAPAKLVVEYGVPVAIFWLCWFLGCMFVSGVPVIVIWAMFLQYIPLQGCLIVPLMTYYVLVMAGLFRPTRYDEPERARPSVIPREGRRWMQLSPALGTGVI